MYAGIPNRYMDRELFFQWVEVTLIENMKHLGKSLLMLDEYGSHLSVSVIDHCCENDVLSYYSLPHKYFLATGCVCGYMLFKDYFSKLTDHIKLATCQKHITFRVMLYGTFKQHFLLHYVKEK